MSFVVCSCMIVIVFFFFFSSRRRHTRSVSAFLLNRSSDLSSEISESVNFCVMEAIKLCRLDTPIIFIEARINLSRFVVTGCAAKTSATVTWDEKWFLENEKTVTQFCRKLAAERPLKDIRDEYNYPKKKGIKDECSRLLEASTMKSRRGFAIQRLMNAMRQAHADGWFIVFDTLTLADDRL